MSGSNGRRPPLIADRRYGPSAAKKTASNGGGGRGSKPPPKAAPKRRTKKRDPLSAAVAWVFGLIWGIVMFFWRILWGVGWRILAAVALVVGLSSYYFYSQLPEVAQLVDGRARGSVTMLDREGKVFAWRGETYGGMVTSDKVSKYLREAVVATEDRRFYRHFGVSPRGIASAVRINLSEGRGPLEGNGGSTITQQVAKLLCLGVQYDPKEWKSEADYEPTAARAGSGGR